MFWRVSCRGVLQEAVEDINTVDRVVADSVAVAEAAAEDLQVTPVSAASVEQDPARLTAHPGARLTAHPGARLTAHLGAAAILSADRVLSVDSHRPTDNRNSVTVAAVDTRIVVLEDSKEDMDMVGAIVRG